MTPGTHQTLIRWLSEHSPDTLLADGYEEAILGVAAQGGTQRLLVVYDRPKCLKILMDREKWTEGEAEEWFSFNTEGAFVGEFTPLFFEPLKGWGE